jgi:hypothetical protein
LPFGIVVMIFALPDGLAIGAVVLGAGCAIGAAGPGFAGGFIDCAIAAVLIKAAIAAAEAKRIIMEGSFAQFGIEPVLRENRYLFHSFPVPRAISNGTDNHFTAYVDSKLFPAIC